MAELQAFIAWFDPAEQFGFYGREIFIAVIDVYEIVRSKNNHLCSDMTKTS